MRRRPALEVEAAVGILRIDAVAERVALEVRKRRFEAERYVRLDEVRAVDRADDLKLLRVHGTFLCERFTYWGGIYISPPRK